MGSKPWYWAGYFKRPRDRRPVNLRGSLRPSGMIAALDVWVRTLSPTGAMIEHRHGLVPGDPCLLHLELGGRTVPIEARVAWCKVWGPVSDPAGWEEVCFRSGLHFSRLPEPTEVHLREYLTTMVGPQPSARLT